MEKILNITIPAWHFINDNCTLRFPHKENNRKIRKVFPGQILKTNRALEMCDYGLHGSLKAVHAFRYNSTNTVCRVNLSGEIFLEDDKMCASVREVLWIADISKIMPKLFIWLNEELFLQLKRISKKKDPFSLKELSFLRQISKQKQKQFTVRFLSKYFNIINQIMTLNNYSYNVWQGYEAEFILNNPILSKNKNMYYFLTCSDSDFLEKFNSKFEELIYSAPKIK